MANNVLEEKFPFLQEGVFLIAQVNAMTGQQRLLMQKVDPRTGQVLIKDAINCIHVAVGNIPTEEFEATADAADFPEDVLRIRSSEKLKEISLA
ncbi:MAG TPA: hypothetical protein VKK79_11230, partial [Candidatus Lokiarchaeia archaeon]|nr:hypothetical protein [Candidatus Lokiarchaeia archaeon]